MKTLGAIAIVICLITAGCGYHDRYRHRAESGTPGTKSGERMTKFVAPAGKLEKASGAPGRTSNASCAKPGSSFTGKCGTPTGIGGAISIAIKPCNYFRRCIDSHTHRSLYFS
jgi:hypothetical protein